MSRCVILSAGPVEDPEVLRPLLRDDDWFIAADGGMRLAERLGVTPGLIVADFDSGEAPRETRAEVLRLPAEKDWTDTMAAAMAGLERGFRDFLLLGCTGGRLDHTIANLAVMLYIHRQGGTPMMADERNRVFLYAPSSFTIPPQKGWKLSLFPYGGEVRGVTLRDVRYLLTDATLTTDNPVGVSNEFLDCPARISFQEGILLLLFSKD